MPASDDVKEVAQQHWREQDWVDADDVSAALDLQAVDAAAALYEDCPDAARFRGDVTRATLTEWYLFRAAEIERLSKQVDHALSLIELGIDRCVPGLDVCRDNLASLSTLVYECHVTDSVSLDDVSKMADIDVIRLMLSQVSLDSSRQRIVMQECSF